MLKKCRFIRIPQYSRLLVLAAASLLMWHTAAAAAVCNDGEDNDNDGYADYGSDDGCVSPSDSSEREASIFPCDNGRDDDADGLSDFPGDPGCSAPWDDDESNQTAGCGLRLGAVRGPLPNGDYSDKPIRASFMCPPGYVVTGVGYKDSEGAMSDAMDGLSISCSRLEADGTLTGPTGYFTNPDLASNSRPFGAFDCPADGVYNAIPAKDFPVYLDSDIMDGVTSSCTRIGRFGLGQSYPIANNGDLTSSPRDQQGLSCPGGTVLVGVAYDDMGAAWPDATDTFLITCQELIVDACAVCSDGVDNDGDGMTDYPADPGCTSPEDGSEYDPPAAECSDGLDNDADGKIDYPADPGCSSPPDDDEYNPPAAQCSDGLDNDGDGRIDHPADQGCSSPNDNDESNPPAGECCDGRDNDGDGKVDYPADPGCTSPDDSNEYNTPAQCSDGNDNDQDGYPDYGNDDGCVSPNDDSEREPTIFACDNGLDDDHDGLSDYPNDRGCSAPWDNDETDMPVRCSGVSLSGASLRVGLEGDYSGKPIAGDFSCPAGYAVTGVGYKDLAQDPNSDAVDGFSIACKKLESDGSLSSPTGYAANPDLATNPRGFGAFDCPEDAVYTSLPAKDFPIYLDSDLMDGSTSLCTRIGGGGLGASYPIPPNSDIDTSPRDRQGLSCPSGYVLTGLAYDNMGAAWPDATDTFILACQAVVVNACTACRDGLDNDGDGKRDYPADPGCSGPDDGSEDNPAGPKPVCSDRVDNDHDGYSDFGDDDGCVSPNDDSEREDGIFLCDNGRDDDADGLADFPNDPGCFAPWDMTENCPAARTTDAGSCYADKSGDNSDIVDNMQANVQLLQQTQRTAALRTGAKNSERLAEAAVTAAEKGRSAGQACRMLRKASNEYALSMRRLFRLVTKEQLTSRRAGHLNAADVKLARKAARGAKGRGLILAEMLAASRNCR